MLNHNQTVRSVKFIDASFKQQQKIRMEKNQIQIVGIYVRSFFSTQKKKKRKKKEKKTKRAVYGRCAHMTFQKKKNFKILVIIRKDLFENCFSHFQNKRDSVFYHSLHLSFAR